MVFRAWSLCRGKMMMLEFLSDLCVVVADGAGRGHHTPHERSA
jgi:hypothetical protein